MCRTYPAIFHQLIKTLFTGHARSCPAIHGSRAIPEYEHCIPHCEWHCSLWLLCAGSPPLDTAEFVPCHTIRSVSLICAFAIFCPQFSKIGKVMRHVHALADDKVPRDEEFKFRDRAKALVEKWHEILSASKAPAEGTVRKPVTNGKAHTEESGEKAKENGKEESPAQDSVKAEADAMDVDKKDGAADAEAEADAPAEADDALADGAADESVLADVTMSEGAAETA